VDGFVQATWKIVRAKGTARLDVRPLRALTKGDTAAIADEGSRLLGFLAEGATHDVQILAVAE
jgi:hypothetical protein